MENNRSMKFEDELEIVKQKIEICSEEQRFILLKREVLKEKKKREQIHRENRYGRIMKE